MCTEKSNIKIGNNTFILLIWDRPDYKSCKGTIPSIGGCSAFVFVVFDVSDKNSFANIEDFIDEVHLRCSKNKNHILYIIGNKNDKGAREVKEDEARYLAELKGCKYFETSAKTGENVELVFKSAIE